jgi:hypothetical protein
MYQIQKNLLGIRKIELPQSWRADAPLGEINFMLFAEEFGRNDIVEILKYAKEENIVNPRPITKKIIAYCSILHPRLYFSAKKQIHNPTNSEALTAFLQTIPEGKLGESYKGLSKYNLVAEYYNSLLFLSGCTLSAAVIQNRYSEGTIDSKLNRLWQFLFYWENAMPPSEIFSAIKKEVVSIGNNTTISISDKLYAIKKLYAQCFEELAQNTLTLEYKTIKAKKLGKTDAAKFGFMEELKNSLGANLQCVLVYGSSVTSNSFNDYDLIIVVTDEDAAFKILKGTSPKYNNFDLNISVYSIESFKTYQIFSGDNLDLNVQCIYGTAAVPIKSKETLVLRNFSFAIIRLRQLLGMASFLSQEGKHFGLTGNENIYHYFIKIPMHITKGVRSAFNDSINKEWINNWTMETFKYSIPDQMTLCTEQRTWQAIANSYIATLQVMDALNKQYSFISF